MNRPGHTPGRGRLACVSCGADHGPLSLLDTCACSPQATLRVVPAGLADGRQAFLRSLQGHGIWRYAALLPVSTRHAGTLQVGGTPLCDGGELAGVRIRFKDDTRQPSGSLKDRATEVALAVAAAWGFKDVVTASTGNAAASLACLAAARGMRATLVVPAATPPAKLAQSRAYGARVLLMQGSYDDAFEHAVALARETGAFCRNTGRNPFVREGKKTVAFEIAEQLGWRAPDWVVVPTGDGSILSSVHKGFEELLALGVIERLPRLVAAQAASSNAIGRSFRGSPVPGAPLPRIVPASPATIADSISVSLPSDHDAAVLALRGSDGVAVDVPEDALAAAVGQLARRSGHFVEPSTAAAWAALQALVAQGRIAAGELAVVLLTGNGLKDPHRALQAAAKDSTPLSEVSA